MAKGKETELIEEEKEPTTFDQFLKHQRQAAEARREAWRNIVPTGFRENMRLARRHTLLSFRVLIDAALERIEAQSAPEGAAGRKKVKVEVE